MTSHGRARPFRDPPRPSTTFQVRVFANAAANDLRALAKLGQAGWKTVGQEYLPPAVLHHE